jgi:hypothetical protein
MLRHSKPVDVFCGAGHSVIHEAMSGVCAEHLWDDYEQNLGA